MQPAAFTFGLQRGDDARVQFGFATTVAGQQTALDLTGSAFELTVSSWGSSTRFTSADGLSVDMQAGLVTWAPDATTTAALSEGRTNSYALVRTTAARGRRTCLVGSIVGLTDQAGVGDDVTLTLNVSDVDVAVTVVDGGKGDPGDFNALLAAMEAAGVLSSAQVASVTAALSGAVPIVAPIPGVLDFSDPNNAALVGH